MSYIYEYELKKASDRKIIDLKEHEDNIVKALKYTFKEKLINFSFYKQYFRFELSVNATDLEKRGMGKKIIEEDYVLNSLKIKYKYGSQLFIGREYISEESVESKSYFKELIDIMYDSRSKCYSILTKMKVEDYIRLIEDAYKNGGHIDGQRDKLKTTTSLRIYSRMIDDVKKGAVLPAIVVGILIQKNQINAIGDWGRSDSNQNKYIEKFNNILSTNDKTKISIIDGMQRTSAFLENLSSIKDKEIRVEFWVAEETSSLTYRMLVLNTGQIPWNLRRQVEVIFSSIIAELKELVEQDLEESIEIYKIDDGNYRTQSGQFQADKILEMYLAFSLRKEQVDVPEKLASEFSRLDMIDSVANKDFFESFIEVFKCFVKLDIWFGKFRGIDGGERFKRGRDIFASQPACIGFFTAAAQKIYGRPGEIKEMEYQQKSIENIIERSNCIIELIKDEDQEQYGRFLSLRELENLIIERGTGKNIGDYERKFFTEAFRLFFTDDFDVKSLLPCWRNY
ncbi:hypothetical protein [Clostridium estertheticum]|uniref:hypothetical protein n=1 Tax=Clostridium estertheticum TaxID=238834 RepID=UPI001CF278AC|nr:hypothetical protein [Clostridium estertheticum]MCB2339958.1 hypothetical protein [Clostridium estertheticum]